MILGSSKVELGASWIHGVLGNPIYEIATANGLIDIINAPKPHKVVAARENGQQVPFPVLQEIYEAYICFLRRCEEYFLCQYLPPEGIQSVGEHLGLETALYLDKITDPEERHLRQLIFDCLLMRETCIAGCNDMKDIDLLELGSYTDLQGGNISLPGGYSNILRPISCIIPPRNIFTSHPVTNIKWQHKVPVDNATSPGYDSGIDLLASSDPGNDSDDSDKTVTGGTPTPRRNSTSISRTSSEKSVIKEESNSQVTSEQVINKLTESSEQSDENLIEIEVTCENGTKFYAEHVICTIPLGVLKEKVLSLFSPRLPKYKLESIKKLSFGTVNKIYLEYSRPFLNPDISEVMLLWDFVADDSDLSSTWVKRIYSFAKVTETLFLGWISGRAAQYIETLSNDVIGEKCTEALRKFLNDPYIPLPKACLCSHWYSQEYCRGSYTSIAVGASQQDIEQIAQPLYSKLDPSKVSSTFFKAIEKCLN